MKRINLIDGNYIEYDESKPKIFYYYILDNGETHKVKCRVTKWLTWVGGMTLYPRVLLNPKFWEWLENYPKWTADLLQHEYFHWQEQKEEGLVKWLAKYGRDWIKVGFKYSKLPDEHQADDFDKNYENK